MKLLKSINIILLTLGFTDFSAFSHPVLSVEEAAKLGFIKLLIHGKGGHIGEVIEMKIQNVSSHNLNLKLEAGRKLDSKIKEEQDIIVTQSQEFFVKANQLKTLNVLGMCCQAHNSSPQKKSNYALGTMADSNLIRLTEYIDKNKYYTNYTAQQAVWTLSDNHSIASISDGEKELVLELRNYVSKITSKEIPPYDIIYEQQNDRDLLGKAKKIEGAFDYVISISGRITIAVYDDRGHQVQLLFENIEHEKGVCKLYYTFRTKDLQPGVYYARMSMGGAVQSETKIEF